MANATTTTDPQAGFEDTTLESTELREAVEKVEEQKVTIDADRQTLKTYEERRDAIIADMELEEGRYRVSESPFILRISRIAAHFRVTQRISSVKRKKAEKGDNGSKP